MSEACEYCAIQYDENVQLSFQVEELRAELAAAKANFASERDKLVETLAETVRLKAENERLKKEIRRDTESLVKLHEERDNLLAKQSSTIELRKEIARLQTTIQGLVAEREERKRQGFVGTVMRWNQGGSGEFISFEGKELSSLPHGTKLYKEPPVLDAPEGQEPVAEIVNDGTPEGGIKWLPYLTLRTKLVVGSKLYARPIPAVPEGLEKDAMRYRWLRDRGVDGAEKGKWLVVYEGMNEHSLLPDELDAAIDKAIAAAPQNGKEGV